MASPLLGVVMQDLGKPSGRAWRPRDWDANRRKAWAKDRHRALGCPVGQEGKLGLIAKASFGVGNVGHRFGSKWGRKGEPWLPCILAFKWLCLLPF